MARLALATCALWAGFALSACAGSEKPAANPSNATGMNPSSNTTGPGAGEPTDSSPQEGANSGTGIPNTTDTGVGTSGSAVPGNQMGTAGH